MPVAEVDHVAIRTADMEGTRDFYVKVLGLSEGPRPDLGYHGYWIYLGAHAIIHLIEPGREMGGGPGDTTGNFDHLALVGHDFPAMKAHLAALGAEFRERHVPNARLRQIFVYDPNRILVEINFRNTD
jgi:catechol 2,3-dioxygenase-like lactoylglutathione lyase family enzyme